MKKILSILSALILVAMSAHATGTVGPNPPQSGVSVFTNNVWTNTITFPYPFQTIPVINSYYVSGPTNVTPFTNAAITTTNFSIEINSTNALGTNAATGFNTNALIAWQAYVGGTRLESGSNSVTAQTPLLITFPYPYAVPPIVVASGNSTNALSVGVSGVTTTNFTASSPGTTMVSWMAIGTVANPLTQNSGSFPQNNTVLY